MWRYKCSPFIEIPQDILLVIFSELTPGDLCNLSKCCKKLNQVASSDALWKNLSDPKWKHSSTHSWKSLYMKWIRNQINHIKENKSSDTCPSFSISPKIQNMPYTNNKIESVLCIKCVMVGDYGAGKSAFVETLAQGRYKPTSRRGATGVEFLRQDLLIDDKPVQIRIWDSAGIERFRALSTAYFRGAEGIFLFYDVSMRETFEDLEMWTEQTMIQLAGIKYSVVVVGAKSDLSDKRQVSAEEGMEFAQSHGFSFIEISSKNYVNMRECIEMLVSLIIEQSYSIWNRNEEWGWPAVVPSQMEIEKIIDLNNPNRTTSQQQCYYC